MILNLRQIAEGYLNLVLKGTSIEDHKVEILSRERMKLCKACPSFDNTGESCTLIHHRKHKMGCCKICGCYMEAKTRSITSKCADPENPKW